MMDKNKFFFAIIILFGLIFTSCSEDEITAPAQPGSNAPLAKFSDIKAKVFVNCVGAQCHAATGNQAGLTLESTVAYNNLVNVQSTLFSQFKRVEPGNSANSLIIKILKGEVSPRMPFNGNALPSATIDSIAKWIDLGSLNN